MLKAKDLHERTLEDLRELEKTLTRDVFQNRFKNFTNRLDDTSSIRKSKKDLARVLTVLAAKNKGLTPVAADAATSEATPKAKKVAAPKAAKSAAKPAAPKADKKKTPAKKSEAK